LPTGPLRRRNRLGLDVVGLEETLEVQDLELIRLLEGKELAERGIRLDHLLVHQVVVLGVRTDTGRDLRAAEQSALRHTEERAESIRDLRGAGEHRLLLDLALNRCGLAAAAALLGLLELTRDLLLELLHVGEDRGERRTESVDLLNERRELGRDVNRHLRRGNDGRD